MVNSSAAPATRRPSYNVAIPLVTIPLRDWTGQCKRYLQFCGRWSVTEAGDAESSIRHHLDRRVVGLRGVGCAGRGAGRRRDRRHGCRWLGRRASRGHRHAVQRGGNGRRQPRGRHRRPGHLPVPAPGARHVCGEGGAPGVPPRRAGQDCRQRRRHRARRSQARGRFDGREHHRQRTDAADRHDVGVESNGADADGAGCLAQPRQHLVYRPGHPERDAEQSGRGRIGVLSELHRHRARQQQRKQVHGRRDGRLEHRWQRDDRRVLPGPVHLPGGELPDRRRFRGDAERRPDVQHDQPHRHQPVSRRRHVQRRQSCDGVRRTTRTS